MQKTKELKRTTGFNGDDEPISTSELILGMILSTLILIGITLFVAYLSITMGIIF